MSCSAYKKLPDSASINKDQAKPDKQLESNIGKTILCYLLQIITPESKRERSTLSSGVHHAYRVKKIIFLH